MEGGLCSSPERGALFGGKGALFRGRGGGCSASHKRNIARYPVLLQNKRKIIKGRNKLEIAYILHKYAKCDSIKYSRLHINHAL